MDTPDAPDHAPDDAPEKPASPFEAARFERLVSDVRLGDEPDERRHGRPFMERAVFDFGRRRDDEPAPPQPIERSPCPLCGEPNRLRHAYCSRCGFRLPWAAQVEGLPEAEPRPDRIDHALNRAVPKAAACRYCNAPIEPYDRRCSKCGRWLVSGWSDAEIDPWQPDFDRWNLSQVRGIAPRGCLSPFLFALALVVWRALA